MALSPYCTASCSLLVSPHSHRQGSAIANGSGNSGGSSAHARVSPLRKRNYSFAEKDHDSPTATAGHRTIEYSYHHSTGEHERARMMAVTRLNPTLTVYRPVQDQHPQEESSTNVPAPSPTSNEDEDLALEYSQL
ncbi:hypothetical protein BG015_011819 [Linnemannia schmuckeri]|uniref:Uncharacterized protein n=1 Tax=Linnemannia schmuckeri TaxID=64567 RepID=A0A9P5V888_9FUNG|nr:hypothetical protein BG015_011819 [Linnemannia schmuckeri]